MTLSSARGRVHISDAEDFAINQQEGAMLPSNEDAVTVPVRAGQYFRVEHSSGAMMRSHWDDVAWFIPLP